ncbi:Gfo/Idh/MocA family oxidoreductase [Candidatus Poribacteria bacterium]|nr:Gfo/Idh/MocA family oxidoreductase [Candidatus Poribacteria bacterium]MYB64588.1 Gfo/Idh/MocA family oxidoreductase [Candidatus Poribacteria bacterium]MYF55720.1 Gfo/Idh/MocA family oxidoreductase [Candidatus Poribacteria bacterium]MYI93062.1 Gfo/Idh/MocA family oxidoreductase [Candidatus Poribacteria bacterium]
MYKTAILGCRGRARAHAGAYRFVKGGKLAAICDMNEERLNDFGDRFEITSRYTDLDEMLEKEKPDLLHIVTAPVLRGTNQRIRYPLMKQASDHGVPAVIVEKPVAVESEDWKQIAGLAEETETKIVVNTQLNFHPKNLELKRDVAESRIGALKFIDASARNPPVNQAPHVLQLVSSYIDNSRPVKVLGQISGSDRLDSDEPSPMHAAAHVVYENGLHVSLAFGPKMGTLASQARANYRHKRVFVMGTEGFVHWRFSSWERFTQERGYEEGGLHYGEQDTIAQGNLTDAVFDWLDDETKVHPTHLKQSLAEFNLLLGIYYSGITNKVIELPFNPPDGLMDLLRERL